MLPNVVHSRLAVADTTFAAECQADSLSDPSDIKNLGDDCVGVNLHQNAPCSQHPKLVSSASTTRPAGKRVIVQQSHLVIDVKVRHVGRWRVEVTCRSETYVFLVKL